MSTTSLLSTTIANNILPIAIERIRRNYDMFDGAFPSYGDGDTAYLLTANENWLASFWAGLLWLVYDYTKDERDAERAKSLLPSFEARLTNQVRLNHDIGFLFILSARAQNILCQDDDAQALALQAADVLLTRFRPIGQYIQAWGSLDNAQESGRFIIDCMMNLPLLFWASSITGDNRYRDVAIAHARTSQQYLLRDDGSTYHTYYLDPETAEPIGSKTHQGYSDDSLWSRGQGWAVYGFAMAAEWTGDVAFLEAAQRAAACYLAEAPLNTIAPYDLRLPDDEAAHPDSSADAIVAAGLLRLAKLTHEERYAEHATSLLDMLYVQAFDKRNSAQGLLLHGTQHAPHHYGVDTYTIFGDYFFLEALLNVMSSGTDFWGLQT